MGEDRERFTQNDIRNLLGELTVFTHRIGGVH